MAIAAEHLYESCTCESGMRDGLRCGDCNGRGVVSKGTKILGITADVAEAELEAEIAAEGDDELDNMSINHLRSRAKDLGVSAGGSKEALVARIKAAAAGEAPEEAIGG